MVRLTSHETASPHSICIRNSSQYCFVARIHHPDWTEGQSADSALRQADFDSGAAGSTASRVSLPGGIAGDHASGKVFAFDPNNNRVLRYCSHEAPPMVRQPKQFFVSQILQPLNLM